MYSTEKSHLKIEVASIWERKLRKGKHSIYILFFFKKKRNFNKTVGGTFFLELKFEPPYDFRTPYGFCFSGFSYPPTDSYPLTYLFFTIILLLFVIRLPYQIEAELDKICAV